MMCYTANQQSEHQTLALSHGCSQSLSLCTFFKSLLGPDLLPPWGSLPEIRMLFNLLLVLAYMVLL